MSIGTIILIILVIALLGGFSGIGGGPFYGTGYYGGGGLGLIIVILLILLLLGRLYVFWNRKVGKGAFAPCPPFFVDIIRDVVLRERRISIFRSVRDFIIGIAVYGTHPAFPGDGH
jgi:hypothetical protein